MNKNEFYSKLMEENTFDYEKIRTRAIAQKYASKPASALRLAGLVSGIAAVTVIIGISIFSMFSRTEGGIDFDKPLEVLSFEQRAERAKQNYDKSKSVYKQVDLLVTFKEAVSSSQAQEILYNISDEIKVKTAYLQSGESISGADGLNTLFNESGGTLVTGVLINCPNYLYTDIDANPMVYLVDYPADDESFEDAKPAKVDNTEAPVQTQETLDTEPPVITPEITDEPVDIPTTTDNTSSSETVTATDETAETTDGTETQETLIPPEITIPPVTSATETAETTVPPQTTTAEPTQPPVSEPVYSSYITQKQSGVTGAGFLTDSRFYAVHSDGIEIFDIFYGASTRFFSVSLDTPRVHWLASDGSRMLVSSLTDGYKRSLLWWIDVNEKAVYSVETYSLIGKDEIVQVGYNDDEGAMAMIIKGGSNSYLGYVDTSDYGYSFIMDTVDSNTKLVGATKDKVYVLNGDGSASQITAYRVSDLSTYTVRKYYSNPSVVSSNSFNRAAVLPADNSIIGLVEIFDASTASFYTTQQATGPIYFSKTGKYAAVGESFYSIEDGVVSELKKTQRLVRTTNFKAYGSSLYDIISTSSDEIKIGVLG